MSIVVNKHLFYLLIGIATSQTTINLIHLYQNYYKSNIITVYTNNDIYYVNLSNYSLQSETGKFDTTYSNFKELQQNIDSITAADASVTSVSNTLDWYAESGYLKVEVYPTVNTNCITTNPLGEVVLVYDGPNYGVDARVDTVINIATFYDWYDFSLPCGDNTLSIMHGYMQD